MTDRIEGKTMIEPNIADLRKLAESATWTGEWYDGGCETLMCKRKGGFEEVAHVGPLGLVPYLVAVQPAAVLHLLNQLAAFEASDAESIAMYLRARKGRDEYKAEFLRVSAKLAAAASVLQDLIDAATGLTAHRYSGDCPDYDDHDRRDLECSVCNTIKRAEKLLTDHAGEATEMVAVPAGWKLVPTTPHGDMLRSVGKWADAMAYETYTAMLAAAPEAKQ